MTPRGEGFVTASVVDPFGNLLGDHEQPALVREGLSACPKPREG